MTNSIKVLCPECTGSQVVKKGEYIKDEQTTKS
jgi:hypothetical protein